MTMGATKLDHYTSSQIHNAQLGKAIASPARIVILKLLTSNPCVNIPILKRVLKLDESTIQQHISMPVFIGLIKGRYIGKFYLWQLNPETAEDFEKIKWALD